MSELKSLAGKMLKIMAEVGYVQKEGTNAFHNYKYAKEADVVEKVRAALINHGVFAFGSAVNKGMQQYQNQKGVTQFLVSVDYKMTFVDVDSGEQYEATFPGDGADTGDKGVYKAITGGEKYALLKTFLISTGDDPEKEEPAPKGKPTKTGDWGDKISNSAKADELRSVYKEMSEDQREAWADEVAAKRKEFGV